MPKSFHFDRGTQLHDNNNSIIVIATFWPNPESHVNHKQPHENTSMLQVDRLDKIKVFIFFAFTVSTNFIYVIL